VVVLVPVDEPDFDEPESELDFFAGEAPVSLLGDEPLPLSDELPDEVSDPLLDDESLDPLLDPLLDELSDFSPDFSLDVSPEPGEAVVEDPLLLSVL
jgi:hypothetical protein